MVLDNIYNGKLDELSELLSTRELDLGYNNGTINEIVDIIINISEFYKSNLIINIDDNSDYYGITIVLTSNYDISYFVLTTNRLKLLEDLNLIRKLYYGSKFYLNVRLYDKIIENKDEKMSLIMMYDDFYLYDKITFKYFKINFVGLSDKFINILKNKISCGERNLYLLYSFLKVV